MGAFKDITGETKGRLTALRCTGRDKHGKAVWLFRCTCGNEVEVAKSNFVRGHTQSCGCVVREMLVCMNVVQRNRFKNISLHRFGRLVASFPIGRIGKRICWACLCDCGNTVVVLRGDLTSGQTKSCGCLQSELAGARAKAYMTGRFGAASPTFKHGHASRLERSLTYGSWRSMRDRCALPSQKAWVHYGEAGIKVCARWLNSFEAFLEDLGERTAGRTLGRFGDINNYSCGQCEQCKQNGWELNCAWQTYKEQWAERRIKKQSQLVAA